MNLPALGDVHWRVRHDAIVDAFRDPLVHDFGIVVRRESTLPECKTMRYGVKYIAVARTTAVERFESFLLGDIKRGLAARDAATWHNTEPRQKGRLRDILNMSEYMGMIFGKVGEVSKGCAALSAVSHA
eukprot:jgi/Tetstr1/431183/TSEL_020895.t1